MDEAQIKQLIDDYLESEPSYSPSFAWDETSGGKLLLEHPDHYPDLLIELAKCRSVRGGLLLSRKMLTHCGSTLNYEWLRDLIQVWQIATHSNIYLVDLYQHLKTHRILEDERANKVRLDFLKLLYHLQRGLFSDHDLETMEKMIHAFSRKDDPNFPFIAIAADTWTAKYLELIGAMEFEQVAKIERLVAIATKATSAVPKKTLLKSAAPILETCPQFESLMANVLPVIGEEGPVPVSQYIDFPHGDQSSLHTGYSDCLRGLIWMCHSFPKLAEPVYRAAKRCYEPGGQGPFNSKIGTACARTLSLMATREAIGYLCGLQRSVKHESTRKQLNKALTEAADRSNLSISEIEEMSISDCDLNGIGVHDSQVGDWSAQLAISNSKKVELIWSNTEGESKNTIPAELKKSSGAEIRSLSKLKKRLAEEVPIQTFRLDYLFMEDREMRLDYWKLHYAEHLLVGYFSDRLIWEIGGTQYRIDRTGHSPNDWQLEDIDGKILKAEGSMRIKLWHPINSSAKVVERWRNWLFKEQIIQPVKQAFREVYKLTPAETITATYSNRFAAHIVKQHQFSALCKARGWKYALQGNWDGGNDPRLDLSRHGYLVEFRVAPSQHETAGSGVHLYLSTDQIRFYPPDGKEPVKLTSIPPRIFSEVMRHVDLFTSVSSIGNDPEWQDNGLQETHRYCAEYSFGELTGNAKTRREALKKIIPAINQEKRFELGEKFLTVKGDLRTYKIHLGSSHIQMEPNSQYLCIVRESKKSASDYVFLPFEDSILSLIVSKAVLLAGDKKIRDKQILAQIKNTE